MSDDFDIHPAARNELHDVIRYYASIEDDRELAIDFEMIFSRYVAEIVARPLLFNIRRISVRRANLGPRFSEYYIAYMIWRQRGGYPRSRTCKAPPLLLAAAHWRSEGHVLMLGLNAPAAS